VGCGSTTDHEDASNGDASNGDASNGDEVVADTAEPCDDRYRYGAIPSSAGELDPTVCFYGKPPGPEATVADLPMPDASCCERPTPLFFKADEPAPEPTLKVELGRSDPKTGRFVPWQPGQWAPLRYAPATAGFHIRAAFRVVLPGQTAPKVKLKVQAQGHFECKVAAQGTTPIIWIRRDADVRYGYTNASPVSWGLILRIPTSTGSWYRYCGIWLEVRVAVKEPASGAWGEASHLVRTYQSLPKWK